MSIRLLLAACLAASLPARASGVDLVSLALRAQVWDERVLGKEQPQPFDEYDLSATLRLPWQGKSWASWDVDARLLASAGLLRGPEHDTIVASALPMLAFVHRDLRLAVEFGAGLAFLGKHDFPGQDYGGAVQFALTFGANMPVYRNLGFGYRFMHYSDAGAYGKHTIGADFHMLELVYYFR
jgi:hypothetical protein